MPQPGQGGHQARAAAAARTAAPRSRAASDTDEAEGGEPGGGRPAAGAVRAAPSTAPSARQTTVIPTTSTSLSLLPKVSMANRSTDTGTRSITASPTTTTGDRVSVGQCAGQVAGGQRHRRGQRAGDGGGHPPWFGFVVESGIRHDASVFVSARRCGWVGALAALPDFSRPALSRFPVSGKVEGMDVRSALRRPRTWIIAVPIVVVLALVVGPFVYINFIQDDAPDG